MWNKTKAAKMLGIEYPIIQAGMAGGITTPELVAAISNQGALGSIGAGYMQPAQLIEHIRKIHQLTDKPFAVNVFVPEEFSVSEEQMKKAHELLLPYQKVLNITETPEGKPVHTFDDHIDAILKNKVPVCSFTFGLPSRSIISKLKKAGVTLIGTATNVEEAIKNEKAGMDIVVVQGSEAGGHRGTFPETVGYPLIGTVSLVPETVDHVTIPVIAAGGIMDGKGIAAALTLGSQGVQLGTAFVPTYESGADPLYKQTLLEGTEETVLTKAFSGKPARGIKNRFITEMRTHEDMLPPYPVQNGLTKTLRKEAAKQGNPDFMSLWAGQGYRMARKKSAGELIGQLVRQTSEKLGER